MTITRESLLGLEAYAQIRASSRPAFIVHRRLRTVRLGEHLSIQFEDETTIKRQIQEMLHIEKIFDGVGIQGEIDAYAALVPDGSNWKEKMLIEYPDPNERKRELGRLIGVEDHVFVEVEGHARSYAIARTPRRPRPSTSCASSSRSPRATHFAPAPTPSSAATTRTIRRTCPSRPKRLPALPATCAEP